jgi:hypothetical protein
MRRQPRLATVIVSMRLRAVLHLNPKSQKFNVTCVSFRRSVAQGDP